MRAKTAVVEGIPEEGSAERTRLTASALHRRERQAFGGSIQWEAGFFGLFAAIGLGALLCAMALAGAVAVGASNFDDTARAQVEELSFAGGALLLVLLGLACGAGGYVAGRMARFDGFRQGLGVWMLGALMVLAIGIAVWIAGGELNPVNSIDLPRTPVGEGPLSAGAGVALGTAAVVALLASVAGGILGERFHRAVDEAGVEFGAHDSEPAEAQDAAPETDATEVFDPESPLDPRD